MLPILNIVLFLLLIGHQHKNDDPDYCALREFLRTGDEQERKLPHWFSILPSLKRSQFILKDTDIIIKGDTTEKCARWLVPQGL